MLVSIMTLLHSRVFAAAETLFYHAQHARTDQKSLSYDEIQALLKTTAPVAQETGQAGNKTPPPASDLEIKVPAHELTHPRTPRIAGPVHAHVVSAGDILSNDESALRFEDDMQLRDFEGSEANSPAAAPGAQGVAPEGMASEGVHVAGEEVPETATESISREDWMRTGEVVRNNWCNFFSYNVLVLQGKKKGEEPEAVECYEEEVTTNPNTAPLQRIPSLHTLEKYESTTPYSTLYWD